MSVPTILNVDDYQPARYARTQLLRSFGFDVREAGTGRDALQLARAHDPALVILDVNLPDIDGFEVCRRLKESAPTALVPVLHVSATYTDAAHRAHALDTGADGYLTEPVEPRVLLATINALLRMKRAEVAARAAAQQWQATFDAIPDGIALLDAEGVIVRHNDAFARLFADVGVLLGRPTVSLWTAPAEGVDALPFPRMRCTGDAQTAELSRGECWFRVTVNPLGDSRMMTGAVYVVSDITERRRLEEERSDLVRRAELARASAEQASRAREEFLAMLSHELRNPLAPIRLALQSIRGRAEGDAAVTQAWEVIERQVKHLGRLVDDLLDVARLSHEKVELRLEPVSVQRIVTEAVEAARPGIEERGHRLRLSVAGAPIWLMGDPTRLVQVVGNLLTNAAKYTPTGGEIAVTAGVEEADAVIRVRDSGIGIPAELLPNVFDVFTQGDRSLPGSGGGLGLGLAIASSIVAQHGGTLTASSAGPGRGSEFVVRLPRTDVVPDAPSAAVAVEDGQRGATDVLVVDDNVDTCEMLSMALQLEGHRVDVAANGEEALARVHGGQAEVVIIDIGLPDMDGYELAERIRAVRGSATYLVALTGYGQPEDRDRSRLAGFDAHLVKPTSIEELTRLLRERPRRS